MKGFHWIVALVVGGVLAADTALAAATDAVFISVSGKVTVKDPGGKIRSVKNNSTAAEGETVEVGEGGKARLVFFDGSTLDAQSRTQFVLSALRKPSADEKTLRFNLLLGGLVARVRKLMTASSRFEIEAGGVICGVRGTQFSVVYDPSMGLVDLKVVEGSVYATGGGITTTVPAGQERKFLNGMPLAHSNGRFSAPNPIQPTGSIGSGVGHGSLALDDLGVQFVGALSINGSGGFKAPVLGSSLQSGFQLMGGLGTVGIIAPVISLKAGL